MSLSESKLQSFVERYLATLFTQCEEIASIFQDPEVLIEQSDRTALDLDLELLHALSIFNHSPEPPHPPLPPPESPPAPNASCLPAVFASCRPTSPSPSSPKAPSPGSWTPPRSFAERMQPPGPWAPNHRAEAQRLQRIQAPVARPAVWSGGQRRREETERKKVAGRVLQNRNSSFRRSSVTSIARSGCVDWEKGEIQHVQ